MKTFLCLLFCVFYFGLKAQPNLVSNPSFEDYKRCLTYYDNIFIDSSDNVKNWFLIEPIIEGRVWGSGRGMPGWSGASSGGAYFNRCSNKTWRDSLYEGLPQNLSGYQETKTGDGYISIHGFILQLQDYFYENQLIAPKGLYSGAVASKLRYNCINRLKYKGGFFTSACGFNALFAPTKDTFPYRAYTTSSLGMYLCNQIPQLKNDRRIEAKAQINNDINVNLGDTVNWMEISGSFEANGTEQYLLLGSFNDSADIKYFNSYGYKEPWLNKFGLENSYYIDDVSLIPQNTTHYYDSILCSNTPLQLGAVAQADSFEWHDGNKTDKLRQFTQPGLVWVKSWLYGGTVYMWDSINLINQPISTGLPKDTFLCFNQPNLTLTATANDSYLWHNGSLVNSLLVDGVDMLIGKIKVWLTVTKNTCTLTDTVTITQKPAI